MNKRSSNCNPTLTQIYHQPSGKPKTPLKKIRKTKKKSKYKQKSSIKDYFKINKKFIKTKKLKNGIVIKTNNTRPYCICGDNMKLKISKTDKNWNRKFYSCYNKTKGKTKCCNAFIWNNEFMTIKRKLKQQFYK